MQGQSKQRATHVISYVVPFLRGAIGFNKYYPPDYDPNKHSSLNAYRGTHAALLRHVFVLNILV